MRTLQNLLLLCVLVILGGGNTADISSSFEDSVLTQNVDYSRGIDLVDYRLPIAIKPISYEIILVPNLESFTFMGVAKITAEVKQPTDSITLHMGNIQLIQQSLIMNNKSLNILKTEHNKITDKYTFIIKETLDKGFKITIAFSYRGTLGDNMIGFYRSSYINENGDIKWLAATQFQTTHARHAFPCFDEPSLKATFTIRIARHKNYISLSNMPLDKTETLNGIIWDTFKQSVPMSTYLVAFVISEFRFLEKGQFKVWTRPSAINQANYALNIGTKALASLGEMFQQKYHLPKMDMVAIPDFAAGAMENWGLVTYRETRMLCDKEESSSLAQQKVASVIIHELTHMWFGNLVTPQWWGYLWLSEAFARYFQYFGTAEIEVSWNMKEQFVVEQHQTALIVDSFGSSRSMTRNVSSQSEIGGMGDSITYSKGASIIRMMGLTFGTDVFKLALRDYLQENKKVGLGYPDALWNVLQNEINRHNSKQPISVKTIMDTWTTQAGYPIISVNVNNNGVFYVTQERLVLRNFDETATDITWWIPLTWTTQSKANFNNTIAKYWLHTKKDIITLKVNPKEWVIFNVQSSGFYRVNYNYDGWQRIFSVLNSDKFNEIHVLNRAAIMDDLLNLGRAEYQDYEVVLDGTTYLKRETNYLPFKAAFNGLDYLNKRLSGGYKEHYLFKKYILSLIEDQRRNLGYEDRANDDWLTILLRQSLNNWACNLNDEDCIATYVKKFKQWRAKPSVPIKPNERTTAYCTAIRNGNSEDWEYLWKKYFDSNNADDQTIILNALGCSLNTTILERFLEYGITSYNISRIRKQDSTSVFAAVYGSSLVGTEYVLDFVDKHYKDMEKYYGGLNTVATILNGASQHFSTTELINKFQNLINKHKIKFASIIKSLESTLKTAKYELEWFAKTSTSIIRWLQTYDNKKDDITKTTLPTTSIILPTTPTVTTISPADRTEDPIKYRLPTNITPRRYTISVTPYLEIGNFSFDGYVKIEAEVSRATNQITLHSAEIQHHTVSVKTDQGKSIRILNTNPVSDYDFYVISLDEELTAKTNIIIEIEYTGHLNASELRGFYKSSYVNENGETRWLAATHLEPVGARKMFPCFDEPAMKAFFTVQVSVPPGYHATSNMEIKSNVEHINGRRLFTFLESKKMSTYLVALIVSDFKSKSLKTDTNKFTVWARTNAIDQADLALSVMPPLVEFFETKLKLKYQLPKLDMAALPDFPSGAMENWGLLTYKETNMLHDKIHSPMISQQVIQNVIAHEISHQWFGNLVSPLWWKYLWLNEGFARYFQYHATSHVFNDTTLELQFVVDQLHSALSTDSSSSTHAMTHDVYSPKEIRNMFDRISYAKGASILRMMEKTYGSAVFYGALSTYLSKQEYKVATPENLYDAFQEKLDNLGVKNNITTIMNTWTIQRGYPVVHIYIKKNIATLTQERFFLKKPKDTVTDVTWHIPITWASINRWDFNDTTARDWLTKKTANITLDGEDNEWLILNVQQSGYYRVNYEKSHWLRLIRLLENDDFTIIHEVNRAMLIDDLMNLARADYVDYDIVISATTKYLTRESDYLPWRAFYNNLPYLNKRFWGRDIEDLYKKYLISLIEPLYSQLGFKYRRIENKNIKMLRMYTCQWACKLDIGDCKYQALQHFVQIHHSKEIPPYYRDVVYCTAVKSDKTKFSYNLLWKKYLNSNVTADKLVILKSLACSLNRNNLETLLLAAVTENSQIRFQDSSNVFSDVYDTSLIGVEVVMNVIKKHYNIIHQHFGDYTKIKSIVSSLASRLSTYNLYKQYQDLLEWLVDKEPAFKKSIDAYLSTAQYEFDWYNRKVPKIAKELDTLFPNQNYRLPKTLYPEVYNISLTPMLKDGIFTGKVQIYVRVEKDTSIIVLNSNNLVYDVIKVYRNYAVNDKTKAEEIKISDSKINANMQQLKIYLTEFVNAERIMIEFIYGGFLNDEMKGFYRSSYLDNNKKLHWLATTQFEATYARQAFPCFDEPAFKSQFIINIERPKHYSTLSNMPILHHVKSENVNLIWDIYDITEVMSPYLVAFVVSEFEPVHNSTDIINVWGRPEIVKYGDFAKIIAESVLKNLQQFTRIPYSLPKLDLVGIPDFFMGAMENWGLITFREYGLFHHEDITTGTFEKYLITIITHELSHMWFGNLVTCEWWEYIWLNEGFAEYFRWYIADLVRPTYKFMDQFVVYELQPAMLNDAVKSTHPMTNPVTDPKEINGIFDFVTYGKSASVLRMIFNAFGEEIHESVVRDYLNKYEHSTAQPRDLWMCFQQHVSFGIWNVSVEEIMDTWTKQAGYPVVHANLDSHKLKLTQERFRIDKKKYDQDTHEFYWIPIKIVKSTDFNGISLQSDIWLGSEPRTIFINTINDWFIVNYKQTGFYRVNYDTKSWQRLITQLNSPQFESIHVLNRAQIIDDLFNLARASYVNYTLLLDATKYLARETHHLPWKAFFNGFSYVYKRFDGSSIHGLSLLKKHALNLMSKMYDKVGFNDHVGDKHLDELNREMFLEWACKLGKSECIEKSQDLFRAWRKDMSKRIPRNAQPAVYCTAMQYGNDSDWLFLWDYYQKTNFASEKKVILNALGCSTNAKMLDLYLRTAITKVSPKQVIIRKNDVSAVFTSVQSAGSPGVNKILDFLIENIDLIYLYFHNWDEVGTLLYNVANHISNSAELVKLHMVFKPEIAHTLQLAVDNANINLDWYINHSQEIYQWLKKQETENSSGGTITIGPLNIIFITFIALIQYVLYY